MIYTDATKRAMKLCFQAHKDQTDKSGIPYVFHPFYLAEQMPDEDTTVAALLHDVVEDTDMTFAYLVSLGFQDKVIRALKLLTHRDDVPYMEYVAKIKEDPIARTVKLADLIHNSDITRLDTVDDNALARLNKYRKAIDLLKE